MPLLGTAQFPTAHLLAILSVQVSLWGYNLDNDEDTILARSNGALPFLSSLVAARASVSLCRRRF